MKKIVFLSATVALSLWFACSSFADDEKKSSWTLQVGYSPMLVAGSGADDDGDSGAGYYAPIHGGSLSFDWRGKGHWGIHFPLSFHVAEGMRAGGIGVNGAVHFRDREKNFDPYLLMGGKVYIGGGKAGGGSWSGGAVPMAGLGVGLRGYFHKNVGLFFETQGYVLPLPGLFITTVEGRAGISIRF